MPSDEDNKLWNKVVRALAAKYNGPIFWPHVTYFSCNFERDNDSIQFLEKYILQLRPTTLEPLNLIFSEIFNKSCYLEFANNSYLLDMYSDMVTSNLKYNNYHLNPHMSLYYGKLSMASQRQIRNHLPILSPILFDKILIVNTKKTTLNRRDVESWELLDCYNLTSKTKMGFPFTKI